MAIATCKDLCVDAVDPSVGRVLGPTLGLDATRLVDGDVQLDGPTEQHAAWDQQGARAGHREAARPLDVHAAPRRRVLARGATPEDLESSGGTSCATPRAASCACSPATSVPSYRLYEIGVDSVDPTRSRRGGPGVLGAHRRRATRTRRWSGSTSAAVPFESLVFGTVPEPKTVKNRIHWDVDTDDLQRLLDPARPCSADPATTSAGTCWPTRRATSSARSCRGSEASRPRVGCRA